ncbi:hypothetical protein pb186bvf_001403 [Paramecium bursaria]
MQNQLLGIILKRQYYFVALAPNMTAKESPTKGISQKFNENESKNPIEYNIIL